MASPRSTDTQSSAKGVLPCGRPAPQKSEPKTTTSELLKKAILQLNAFCTEKKLNRSEAREKILETIIREARHFTALDLLDQLQKRFPDIGKATLYRNLPVLVESGIIQEGPHDPDGQVLYELTDEDHHDHVVCLDCKRIFEFHDDLIEKRQEQVTSSLGFSSRNHRHVIFANCDYLKKDLAPKKVLTKSK